MKLSDAMEAGFKRVNGKQAFTELFESGGACALGCVYLGMDINNEVDDFMEDFDDEADEHIYSVIRDEWSSLGKEKIECLPDQFRLGTLEGQIIDTNDTKRMSIPDIIKNLRRCKL